MRNSSPTHPELSNLILQARKGDQQAFEQLLDLYTPLIDSMTAKFCTALSAQDGEDLRQEALVAFYHAVSSFRVEQTEVQFGLYAKDCIRNRLISHLRTLKKHEHIVFLDDEESTTSLKTEDDSNPAKRLMDEEAYLALYRQVKQTLSEYENRVWWLYLSGRTAKDIADSMQTEEKSVQNALYRIRKKLRSAIVP